jgi:hypothetical protein
MAGLGAATEPAGPKDGPAGPEWNLQAFEQLPHRGFIWGEQTLRLR